MASNTLCSEESLKRNEQNSMRMAEINTYNSERYNARSNVIWTIINFLMIILGLIILQKKQLLPITTSIFNSLLAIIIIFAIIFIGYKVYDLTSRNNMNYQQYDWDWEYTPHTTSVITYDKEQLGLETSVLDTDAQKALGLSCVGSSCCSNGTKWNKHTKKCVEGFTNNTKKPFPVTYDEGDAADCHIQPSKYSIVPHNALLSNTFAHV